MPASLPPERIEDIRTLFFGQLTDANRDAMRTLTELSLQIHHRNHNGALALVGDVERRIQAMRTILIVFRECLEG